MLKIVQDGMYPSDAKLDNLGRVHGDSQWVLLDIGGLRYSVRYSSTYESQRPPGKHVRHCASRVTSTITGGCQPEVVCVWS